MGSGSPQEKKQKGKRKDTKLTAVFSGIFVVLIALGLWWFLVRDNKQPTMNQHPTQQTAQTQHTKQTPDNNNTTQPAAYDPTENGKYFVIKEWGVRFPVPEGYAGDIKYTLKSDVNLEIGSNMVGNAAYFSSDSMSRWPDYGKDCTPFALLQSPEQLNQSSRVGNFWYKVVNGGALCYADHDSSYQIDFTQKLVAVLHELEPIPNQ